MMMTTGPESSGERRVYPNLAYNPVTLLGVAAALFGLAAIVIFYLLNALQARSNPYLGIFLFMVFPGVLIFGLVLIPIGMWLERRRLGRGSTRPVVVDFGDPRHRNAAITFVVGTCVFLLLTTIGLYETYHYTESVSFCGEVCHAVMEPEHTTYQTSPHAEVKCVECHIGSGADWYVKSKMSGARQVVKALLNEYPQPIPTPVKNLRPAQDTCEQCHWPQKFTEPKVVTLDRYLGDEQNSPWRIRMLMNVGGQSTSSGHASGIHWHIDDANRISYVASDSSRQSFDRVAWRRGDEWIVYTAGGVALPDSFLEARRELGLERTMDCMDCHNRPAHRFASPRDGVDDALHSGRLDASLPWIKRDAVAALSREYATTGEAHESIAAALRDGDDASGAPDSRRLAAVAVVQEIYDGSMFPHMRARWDRYPNHNGHAIFPGCFRCHGSDLSTADGQTISADCNLCHRIVAQGPPHALEESPSFDGLPFRHPVDISGADSVLVCFHCHAGDSTVMASRWIDAEPAPKSD